MRAGHVSFLRSAAPCAAMVAALCTWSAAASAQPQDAAPPSQPEDSPEAPTSNPYREPAPQEASPTPVDEGTTVVLPSGRRVDVGCPVRDSRVDGESIFVVCRDGELLRVDAEAGWPIEPVELHGDAVALFEHGDRLWVEIVRREAIAIDARTSRAAGTAEGSEPPGEAPAPRAEPAARAPGGEFSSAPRTGSAPAAAVRVFDDEPIERPGPPRGTAPGEGSDRDPSLRMRGWEIGAFMRPFLGEDGGGILLQLSATHWFRAPLYLQLELDPLGGGLGLDGDLGVFGASALFGYDHGLFQVGMGIGAWHVEVREFDRFASGIGTALHQTVRLGARDTLHVDAKNTFVLIDGELLYGGTDATLQIPVGEDKWLLFRGGAGIAGHVFGDLAMRLRLTKDEDGGAIFVVPGIGGAGVIRENDGFAGPSVSFGVELRP